MVQYTDFIYYQTEYHGTKVTQDEFEVYARKAQRRMDYITTGKLSFAFPVNEDSVCAVKDCICELVDFMKSVDDYRKNLNDSTGYRTGENGEAIGRIVTSVTSGSESRSYSSGSSDKTTLSEAAKDEKVFDMQIYAVIKENLSMKEDANGVNLLYAGPYPGKREIWE